MRVSIERLRIWLLAGAALLVVVVTGFLGVARFRAHRLLTDLPKKLGADIRQETNSFTYSQTVKGKTVFTVHAAKAIQHNDGKYTLQDVGIAVYGHGDAGASETSERVDRIYGKEFSLDQTEGVVKAVGEVHIDLQAPAAKDSTGKMDYAAGADLKAVHKDEPGRGDPKVIHVKTSGLVYLQKLGVAATDQEIEFEYNGLTGHARGAEYNADSGQLVLQSAVSISGLEHGQPILLNATRAELDRVNHKAVLTQAKYVTVNGDDGKGGRQTVEARHAVVAMRADGGIDRVDGDGGVAVTSGDGMRTTADRGEMLLTPEGRPKLAHMMEHVTYMVDDEQRQAKGNSSEARVSFDAKGQAEKVVLSGGVHLNERVQMVASAKGAKPDKSAWSERELNAATVEMGLATDAAGKTRPRSAVATGSARLKVIDAGGSIKGQRQSAMSADVLMARFIGADAQIDEVTGSGSAALERVSETGVVETSTGDALEVHFRNSTKTAAKKNPGAAFEGGGSEIANAVLTGHVVATRKTPAAKGDTGGPQTDRATSLKASYDGSTQVLTLTGQVQMANQDGTLWADRVAMDQKTGDSQADGGVKASYQQNALSGVVHVLAQRADLKKANDTAIFYGVAGKPARLWQAGSQVEAPVLEFVQKQRRLLAHGDGAGAPMAVHTVLVSTGSSKNAAGFVKTADVKTVDPANGSVAMRAPSVVRVASREMVYSDEARTAEFTGGVKVESADGVMRGDHATAYLQAASTDKTGNKASGKKADAGAGFLGGSVDRVVVSEGIEIDQPGRKATGARLVYTASDGLFVLTGTPAVAPRVVDQMRGMVTGAELRFHAEDESVVISNGDKGGSGMRVHTETRVKRDK